VGNDLYRFELEVLGVDARPPFDRLAFPQSLNDGIGRQRGVKMTGWILCGKCKNAVIEIPNEDAIRFVDGIVICNLCGIQLMLRKRVDWITEQIANVKGKSLRAQGKRLGLRMGKEHLEGLLYELEIGENNHLKQNRENNHLKQNQVK
jgi:hypothetical protein